MDRSEWSIFFLVVCVIFGIQSVLTLSFAAAGLCAPGGTCCGWGPRKIRNANIAALVAGAALFVVYAVIYAFCSDSIASDLAFPLMIFELASFVLAGIAAYASWRGHRGTAWTAADARAEGA